MNLIACGSLASTRNEKSAPLSRRLVSHSSGKVESRGRLGESSGKRAGLTNPRTEADEVVFRDERLIVRIQFGEEESRAILTRAAVVGRRDVVPKERINRPRNLLHLIQRDSLVAVDVVQLSQEGGRSCHSRERRAVGEADLKSPEELVLRRSTTQAGKRLCVVTEADVRRLVREHGSVHVMRVQTGVACVAVSLGVRWSSGLATDLLEGRTERRSLRETSASESH